MVHCDHASILHRYGDMKSQMLDGLTDARTHGRTDGRLGDFILCSMLCIALHRQQQNYAISFLSSSV